MKDHIYKVMKLIDRNYLNKSTRVHHFGKNQDVELLWQKNEDPNKAPHWSFKFVGEEKRYFFTQENVLDALNEHEINQVMFLAYLESSLLQESIFLQMSLNDLEINLGKDRIKQARIACEKFIKDMKSHVDKEVKKHFKKTKKVSKTIRIVDIE